MQFGMSRIRNEQELKYKIKKFCDLGLSGGMIGKPAATDGSVTRVEGRDRFFT